MLEAIHQYTIGLPSLIQWLAIIAAGAIPFVESYFGAVIGVMAGVPTGVAIAAAILGNIASMLLLVFGADGLRRKGSRTSKEFTPKQMRLRSALDKYGVPGVSLVGQTILPSQITSALLVSFGARRNYVIGWQIVSIILWGTAFGLLATFGFDMLRG